MKKLVFTVINDITHDQRMNRICTSLANAGFAVSLIGRELPNSKPLQRQVYEQKRMRLWFSKGKLFYIEYNLRLFWYLLWHNYDVYGATDLDTLLPQFLAAKIKNKPHTYDAHEYFTELPEVVHRPLVQKFWKAVEAWIVPRTAYCYTINQTYADLFRSVYDKDFMIVRNATVLHSDWQTTPNTENTDSPPLYILYQGAVNVGRGVEEMIMALPHIRSDCWLYVCGKGDVYEQCVSLAQQYGVADRVKFFGWVSPDKLLPMTRQAYLGFTFFTKDGESYYYSLANRFFDYFHNGVPQLCMNYPEYSAINQQFEVALLLDDLQPTKIAAAVNRLLEDQQEYQRLRNNCWAARKVYNWQEEEKKLVELYRRIVNE
ncbi:MAG TPA: glycosyltransferase [Chitinophagales bacterium]|nr:glycosyltransferase [Chitinophagales bacterium]